MYYAYSEPITSHALGELAGSRRAAHCSTNVGSQGERHGRHLKSMTMKSFQKFDSLDAYILEQ